MFEIFLDITFANLFKLLAIHLAGPDHIIFFDSSQTGIPDIHHIMVCPHQIELHFIHIISFQETIIQRCLHKRTAIKPIPVKNKNIYTMLCCLFYFHRHNRRICFINIPPQRFAVPIMSGISLLHRHNSFPLTYPYRPKRT